MLAGEFSNWKQLNPVAGQQLPENRLEKEKKERRKNNCFWTCPSKNVIKCDTIVDRQVCRLPLGLLPLGLLPLGLLPLGLLPLGLLSCCK